MRSNVDRHWWFWSEARDPSGLINTDRIQLKKTKQMTCAMLSKLSVVLFASSMLLVASVHAEDAPKSPDNLVPISETIVTSGQPSVAWLETLKAQGFDAVIYLAPPTVASAVKNEAIVVASQGLIFANIPINFSQPTGRDVENFGRLMDGLAGRKVLVHCEINLRASSMTFLYRTIYKKENPDVAYESVSHVWTPNATWKRLMQEQLKKNGINFDPL